MPAKNTLPRPGTSVARRGDFERWKRGREPDVVLESVVVGEPEVADQPAAPPRFGAQSRDVAESLIAEASLARSRGRVAEAVSALEAALTDDMPLRRRAAAMRELADLHLESGHPQLAAPLLEVLCSQPTSDPAPFLALAKIVERDGDAPRAAALRRKARAIAPWLDG